jgi:hypothetical protein
MKSRRVMLVTVITLFASLAIPAGLAGQDDTAQSNKPKHYHYKLVDIGLGGPQSAVFEFAHTLTNRGAV